MKKELPVNLVVLTTVVKVTNLILWAIRKHGLEKTLEDIGSRSAMVKFSVPASDSVYRGYLATLDLAVKAFNEEKKKGGLDFGDIANRKEQ